MRIKICLELLAVNESGTPEEFANVLRSPYFRCLENDYVKMVKKLEKIEGLEAEIDLNSMPTEETAPDLDAVPTHYDAIEEDIPDLC